MLMDVVLFILKLIKCFLHSATKSDWRNWEVLKIQTNCFVYGQVGWGIQGEAVPGPHPQQEASCSSLFGFIKTTYKEKCSSDSGLESTWAMQWV